MNILYLAHRLPYPPNKGDKMRAFRHIQWLSRKHRVFCACFIDDPSDFRHIHQLRGICTDVATIELHPRLAQARGLASHVQGRTITEGYYRSSQMSDLLAHWHGRIAFDAVLAFSSSMAPYALNINAPWRILDLCDLDSQKWLEYSAHKPWPLNRLFAAEASRLFAQEHRFVERFDAVTLATRAEAAPLRASFPIDKIHVIRNGVDMAPHCGGETKSNFNPVVGFIGVMNYFPNVDAVCWFATHCWPAIRRRFPEAVFRIVGRRPVRVVRKLASAPGIEVVGEVEDVRAELANFDVSVAPLRIARGIQNKVLEAMAAAKPVVLASKAAAGVAACPGRDYHVADAPAYFIESVCSLLNDENRRRQIGTNAHQFVRQHCQWEPELEKLEALLMGLLTKSIHRERQTQFIRRGGVRADACTQAAPDSYAH